LKEGENKFSHIRDSGLKWALERTDRQLEFEKTVIFKLCAIVFIVAILCALSTIFIGRTRLGFGVGFISILLLGAVSIIWLAYVDLVPFIRRTYASCRRRYLSKKVK
jgi:hypothetical protein